MSECWFEKMCMMALRAKGHLVTIYASRIGITAYMARFLYKFLVERLGCRRRGFMKIKIICPKEALLKICENYLAMAGLAE